MISAEKAASIFRALKDKNSSAMQELLATEPLRALRIGDQEFPTGEVSLVYRAAYMLAVALRDRGKTEAPHPFEKAALGREFPVQVLLEAGGWSGDFEALRPHINSEHVGLAKVELWRQIFVAAYSKPETFAGRA